jgi:hypothetical protein
VEATTLAQFIMGDDTLQLHRLAVIHSVDASGLSIGEEKEMWNVVGVCIPSSVASLGVLASAASHSVADSCEA